MLCSTEVAVKSTILHEYSYDSIMYEAKVMTHLSCGHPNLPLFIGVYDHKECCKPLLVMKFYSVGGKRLTLHKHLQDHYKSHLNKPIKQWAHILVGVCNGLIAIHQKGYLHNDLKCDNVVLSDCIPSSGISPSVWPIIVDFGKARCMQSPRRYKLTEIEKKEYHEKYSHLAPELVSGLCPQSASTDVYSLGHIIKKVAIVVHQNPELKKIADACKSHHSKRPSVAYVQDSLLDL